MKEDISTLEFEYFRTSQADPPVPGALLVYSGHEPKCVPLPLVDGELVIGRGTLSDLALEDLAMSRRHARVTQEQGQFRVEDLGSRNGLVLDGLELPALGKAPPGGRVLRVGHSVFLLFADLRPYLARPLVLAEGEVVGPILARAWDDVAAAAEKNDVLHLNAESGAGKELGARRFHALSQRKDGPFVAVNCAAIPQGVAERLLFGAKKGAYSGASDSVEGYFQAAHGGTLFLDEVAELELEVQPKLLRATETQEILPLGASRAERVDVRVVSATHRQLRGMVAENRFREDLFFRLCLPVVRIPPLRERPEEMAFLAHMVARRVSPTLQLSPAFVEACLLREWPGNVRELLRVAEDAAHQALRRGLSVIEAELLDGQAGRRAAPTSTEASDLNLPGPRGGRKQLPEDAVIEAALLACEGRVATAAKQLGVHRNQLRRWLEARSKPQT